MAKRVKALNERREQLKAGIVASTSKRAQTSPTATKWRKGPRLLSSLKVLPGRAGAEGQQKLMQAGIRSKDPRLRRHLRALVLPLVFAWPSSCSSTVIDYFPDWGSFKKYRLVAGHLILRLQGAGHLAEEQGSRSAPTRSARACRRARPAGDLRRAGLTVDAAFSRVSRELARPIRNWATSSR
jgi:tight adherence protein C